MYIDIVFPENALSSEDAEKLRTYLFKSSFFAGLKASIKEDTLSGAFDEEEHSEQEILKLYTHYNEILVAQVENYLKQNDIASTDYSVSVNAKTSAQLLKQNDNKIHISDEIF